MWVNIFIACILILFTVFVHALATRIAMKFAKKRLAIDIRHEYLKPIIITQMVLMMFFASIIEATIWASSYVWLGAISSMEKALYFSIVTFTTLGYGDISLEDQWQLLSSFEASIGIIIFGWTTAIVMIVVQRIYLSKKSE